jgi:hypothetical protein
VKVLAYVLGRQVYDLLPLALQTLVFLCWMYIMAYPPLPLQSYYTILLLVGWYVTGLAYLVAMLAAPQSALMGGIALGLLLGGVANGIAPAVHSLQSYNPLLWMNYISYTRSVRKREVASLVVGKHHVICLI